MIFWVQKPNKSNLFKLSRPTGTPVWRENPIQRLKDWEPGLENEISKPRMEGIFLPRALLDWDAMDPSLCCLRQQAFQELLAKSPLKWPEEPSQERAWVRRWYEPDFGDNFARKGGRDLEARSYWFGPGFLQFFCRKINQIIGWDLQQILRRNPTAGVCGSDWAIWAWIQGQIWTDFAPVFLDKRSRSKVGCEVDLCTFLTTSSSSLF